MKRLFLVVGMLAMISGSAFAQNPVIIPGINVGKFYLGVTRQDVLKIAPNPQENMPTSLKYINFSTGNTLTLGLSANRVSSVCFTNQVFNTVEGITGGNFDNVAFSPLFTHRVDKDGDDEYQYVTGGLIFWRTRSGARWGCLVFNGVLANAPSVQPRQRSILQAQGPLTFRQTVDGCIVKVRQETRTFGYQSQFDAYVNADAYGSRDHVSFFGNPREIFAFKKCLNEKGHPLLSDVVPPSSLVPFAPTPTLVR